MAPRGVARPTPWRQVFEPLEDRYEALRAVPPDPASFSRNPDVQRLLADIESPDLVERAPVAVAEYLHLLFADWQHWTHRRPVRALSADALNRYLDTEPQTHAPHTTYLQMPVRQLWMQPDPAGAHEPLDGCYVVPFGRGELLVVAIVGLHPGRVGLGQITLSARADDLQAARDALPDDAYAPAMAGGGSAGLRSVRTGAELLHLVRVALHADPS